MREIKIRITKQTREFFDAILTVSGEDTIVEGVTAQTLQRIITKQVSDTLRTFD